MHKGFYINFADKRIVLNGVFSIEELNYLINTHNLIDFLITDEDSYFSDEEETIRDIINDKTRHSKEDNIS